MISNSGRALLILCVGLWVGSLIHLAYSVAPVQFSFAKAWSLQGVNPDHPQMVINQRAIAGYLTAQAIERTETLQSLFAIGSAIAIFLLWFPKSNRNILLAAKTSMLLIMCVCLYLNQFLFGAEMFDLLQSGSINFAETVTQFNDPERIRFDELHKIYSKLTSITAVSGVILLISISYRPFEQIGTKLQ